MKELQEPSLTTPRRPAGGPAHLRHDRRDLDQLSGCIQPEVVHRSRGIVVVRVIQSEAARQFGSFILRHLARRLVP